MPQQDPASVAFSAFNQAELQDWAERRKLPAYRARQLFAALNSRAVHDVVEMTEFPKVLRRSLAAERPLRSLQVVAHRCSPGDQAEKVLFSLWDKRTVETVLIPSSSTAYGRRYTVCVSSQVGCPAGCTFCATGLSGFGRNLTAHEITDQVHFFAHRLHPSARVTNVVFMGMGEPFLNTPAVRAAVDRLTDPAGFALGQRHITISTVGIVPQIRAFAEWGGQVNLAISLHAPNDELRTSLVPYNSHFPISELLDAAEEYVAKTRRRVSFEYVLLKGTNDALPLATELARLLSPLRGMAHVNLIPWNPFREGHFIRSAGPDADSFCGTLRRGGVNATIRYSKGLDISAACGQLRDQVAQGDTQEKASSQLDGRIYH